MLENDEKNSAEPKDVVKNWMRQKNTLEYLGLWEKLNNPNFKGVEFDPLLAEAGSNAFTMKSYAVGGIDLGYWHYYQEWCRSATRRTTRKA